MFRYRAHIICLIGISAILTTAAEATWKERNINQWTLEDVQQILTTSPWAKTSTGMISRLETEDERREGGKMGQDHGVGFDGVDAKASTPTIVETLRGKVDPRRSSQPISLRVRWESALPIRAAEAKAGVPTPEGQGYILAVYGVPGGYFDKDPKTLGNPLKRDGALRREGKKDVKPSSVEVFQREDGLVVVYQFPASAEITPKDGFVDFTARIGRIAVVQRFKLEDMRLQGNLEL